MDENQMVIDALRGMIREELAPLKAELAAIKKDMAELQAEFSFVKTDLDFLKDDIEGFKPAVQSLAEGRVQQSADLEEIKNDLGEVRDTAAMNRSTLSLILRWSEKADKKFNVNTYEPGSLEKENK